MSTNFVVIVVPAIIGIFFGAPLVARELESGTFKLAWTQDVSRTRWLLSKLAVVGLTSMGCAAVVSVAVTWWSSPIDRVNQSPFMTFRPTRHCTDRLRRPRIRARDHARHTHPPGPPGDGRDTRRFATLRLVVYHWVRPPRFADPGRDGIPGPDLNRLGRDGTERSTQFRRLGPPSQTIPATGPIVGEAGGIGPNGNLGFSIAQNGQVSIPGAGICHGVKILNVPPPGASGNIAAPPSVQAELHACINNLHLRELLTYQPANRYWPFQLYETGIFLGLALLLGGFSVWWIRNRLS